MSEKTFDKVVHLLESVLQSIKADDKERSLNQIKELIVYKDPELLDNFFEDMLGFLNDSSASVRQCIIEFIGNACEVDNSFLFKSVERMKYCTDERSANVLKKLTSVMTNIYRLTLTKAVNSFKNVKTPKDVQAQDLLAFEYSLLIVEDLIKKMLTVENAGLIMIGIKLIESIIILQSEKSSESEVPKSHEDDISLDKIPANINCALLDLDKLKEHCDYLFSILIEINQKTMIQSALIHTFMQSFTNIAKQRPQFLGKIINIFEYSNTNLPDSLSEHQVSSVRKSLKTNLLNLLKHQSCIQYQQQVTTLLTDLGASQSEINRVLPKIDESTRKRKRKDETSNAKKMRSSIADDPDYLYNASIIRMSGSTKKETVTSINIVDKLAKDLIPKLNTTINVADLVLLSMTVLPESMPATFKANYCPINEAGSPSQIQYIARLLANQLYAAGFTSLDSNSLNNNNTAPNRHSNVGSSLLNEISSDLSLPQNKINSNSLHTRSSLTNFELDAVTTSMSSEDRLKLRHTTYWNILESSDLHEICRNMLSKASCSFNTIESTRAITNSDGPNSEQLNTTVVGAGSGGSINTALAYNSISFVNKLPKWYFKWFKIMVNVPNEKYATGELYSILIQNCVDNIRTKFDVLLLLLSDLYKTIHKPASNKGNQHSNQRSIEPASSSSSRRRRSSSSKYSNDLDTQDHSADEQSLSVQYSTNLARYNDMFVSILKKLITNDIKQTYIGRLLLEAPLLTDGALGTLRDYCSFKMNADYGFQVVRDLINCRSEQRETLLQIVLDFSHDNSPETRNAALQAAKWLILVKPNQFAAQIINFATENLNYLLEVKPSKSMIPLKDCNFPLADWSDYAVRPILYLFLSLMPLRPSLIHVLNEIFIEVSQMVKHSIMKAIDIAIKEIGMENMELLRLIDDCNSQHSVALIARIVHILTDKCDPTSTLVNKVKYIYHSKFKDVRLLIPILRGLDKTEIIDILPDLVKQNEKVLTEAFRRLLEPHQSSELVPDTNSGGHQVNGILPEELLVALHQLESRQVDIKTIIEASKLCFRDKAIFTHERLSTVISQLLDLPVLPTLFMRTIMQSISNYPRMANYVVSVLVRLIHKQIWKNSSLWAGFTRCCEKLGAQSYPVLLQLPVDKLSTLLQKNPEFRPQLSAYLRSNISASQKHGISSAIISLIEQNTHTTTNQEPTATLTTTISSSNDNAAQPLEKSNAPIVSGVMASTTELSEEDRRKREKVTQYIEANKISFLPPPAPSTSDSSASSISKK